MADPPEKVRLEIAFRSGQSLTINLPATMADELEAALTEGEPETVALEAEDGRYTVAVRMIAFVKRHARESRVGFGS